MRYLIISIALAWRFSYLTLASKCCLSLNSLCFLDLLLVPAALGLLALVDIEKFYSGFELLKRAKTGLLVELVVFTDYLRA